jgi:membrane fusion protein, copper/silver efflux system
MNHEKNLNLFILASFIAISVTFISCGQDEGYKSHNKDEQKSDIVKIDSSIVREGEINLKAIDVNGDGMVFQDPMDWNVISDVPGKCPLCGMKLKEVSIEKAKENLINHDFKVIDM